jgi:folate-binding protein YgfZ
VKRESLRFTFSFITAERTASPSAKPREIAEIDIVSTEENPNDYQATLEGAAFYPQGGAGCLRLGGADRLAFLQRLTTNDVNLLSSQRSVLTVLVSPTARLLDVLRLVQDGESILALTLPGHGAATYNYLRQRIFFMDKVSLEDASPEYAQLDIEGPQAGAVLQRSGFSSIPGMDEAARVEISGHPARLIGQTGLTGAGYRLLLPASLRAGFEDTLLRLGAARLSAESHQVLRVEAGLPGAGAELIETYTPLEVGLDAAVSGAKGCYTGQEVLARQLAYDKVTQRLVRLKLDAPVPAGIRLYLDDEPAGEITSAAISPRFGPIALAVVRRPFFEARTVLTTREGGVRGVIDERYNSPHAPLQG